MAATARTQDVVRALITVELTRATLHSQTQEALLSTETMASVTAEAMVLVQPQAGEIL